MSTLLFTFRNDEQKNEFINILHGTNNQLILDALETVTHDIESQHDSERLYSLFVSGQKLVQGSIKDMNNRFEQEVGVHSGSVEIRERRGDKWVVIRSRMRQQR